jgi:hypothetical protein
MKLTKALKYKNQLAGDPAELKDRLATQNSRASTVLFDYDANQVLGAIRKKRIQPILMPSVKIQSAKGQSA